MHKKVPNIFTFISDFKKEKILNLNKNIGIIFRNYREENNKYKILEIKQFCKSNNRRFYLANNIKLAMNLNLDGAYIPSFIKNLGIKNYNLKKNFLIMGSAHNIYEIKQKEKQEKKRAEQLENIQAQAQANAQSAEKAAMADVQKEQALAQTKVQIEQAKTEFEIKKMEQEALIKKQLMAEEFRYNIQLEEMRSQTKRQKETEIEDRKDKRVQMQGTQESELINQRQNDTLPVNFESAGNDNLDGFGLEQFAPQ